MVAARNSKTPTLCLLAVLAMGSPPAAVQAAPILPDGPPTPQACAALGFAPTEGREGAHARGRRYSSAAQAGAPPLAMPSPSAFGPPGNKAGPAMQEMVVTGSYASSPTLAQPNTERYPHAQANPVRQTSRDPVSTFSIDADTAAYANARRFLNDGQTPPSDAVRVDSQLRW